MKLILASISPQRRELLKTLGIPFEVQVPRFIEYSTTLSPYEEALLFAEKKARSVEEDHPQALILGSDTLVAVGGRKLGKPRDEKEAGEMLHLLSGKRHDLYTAVALLNTETGEIKRHVEEVHITFRSLTEKEIEDYVATGEPLDKAGAYAIQGRAEDFVKKIEGDLDAVIGLPLWKVKEWLDSL